MIPTFRPWTHTSNDSYIFQLSLVVATATVSYFIIVVFVFAGILILTTSRVRKVGINRFTLHVT